MLWNGLKQAIKTIPVFLLVTGAAAVLAQATTTTTLVATAGNSGSTITAAVHVTGSGILTGVVTILAAPAATPTVTHELGSASTDAEGNATLVLPANTTQGELLSAQYRGNPTNSSSTSTQVQPPSLTALTLDYDYLQSATTFTIKAGATGTSVATVTPSPDFTQSVSFYCTGLPDNSQCVFTPSTVQTTGGVTTSTLQILTTAPSGFYAGNAFPKAWALSGSLAAGLLLVSLRRRKRDFMHGASLIALSAVLVLGFTGCNARYNYKNHVPSPANVGTPPGSYNITITASSTNGITVISHIIPVVLTVN